MCICEPIKVYAISVDKFGGNTNKEEQRIKNKEQRHSRTKNKEQRTMTLKNKERFSRRQISADSVWFEI